ncbi:MAG: hypothetical protein NVSMB47_01700 [Polyangiales bacterium]
MLATPTVAAVRNSMNGPTLTRARAVRLSALASDPGARLGGHVCVERCHFEPRTVAGRRFPDDDSAAFGTARRADAEGAPILLDAGEARKAAQRGSSTIAAQPRAEWHAA